MAVFPDADIGDGAVGGAGAEGKFFEGALGRSLALKRGGEAELAIYSTRGPEDPAQLDRYILEPLGF